MNSSLADLTEKLKQLYQSGVVINPWLAGIDSSGRFDPGVFERLDTEANEYATIHWTESEIIENFDNAPVPKDFPRIALYESFASTAVFLAHERRGDLLVSEEMALDAINTVETFCRTYGFGALVYIYRLLTTYDNFNAINYYGSIPEREFLLGTWHRPWVDYSLHDDLLFGVLLGSLQLIIRDNRRYVELTSKGFEFLTDLRQALEASGHLAQRVRLLHVSQFNLFDDYEKLGEEVWPQAMPLRRLLLESANIRPGMKILELGSGSGLLTFEAGLADRVGSTGRLVCMDPSAGMLNRAKAKSQAQDKTWIDFQIGQAEKLPFADNSFDAVIGCAFLHFTDRDAALKEMQRVTRPGGTVASLHPLAYDFNSLPFFRQWFSPVFQLASKRDEQPKTYLFNFEEGKKAFERARFTRIQSERYPFPMLFHDPEKVVKHFIHGVGLFQEELADLPWKARQEVMEKLRAQGTDICREYPQEDLIVPLSSQLITGIVS